MASMLLKETALHELNTANDIDMDAVLDFVESFIKNIQRGEIYLHDPFPKYPGEFVKKNATRSIDGDMTYSFEVCNKPTGGGVIEKNQILLRLIPNM